MTSIQIKISEARTILRAIGIPLGEGELKTELRQDRLALTLLAVADIKPSSKWEEAKIHGDGNGYALRIGKLRHLDLERLTARCRAGRIFVSVFQNREEFRKWIVEISWETEVWLVDEPSHMIHFDGDKFLGPHRVDG